MFHNTASASTAPTPVHVLVTHSQWKGSAPRLSFRAGAPNPRLACVTQIPAYQSLLMLVFCPSGAAWRRRYTGQRAFVSISLGGSAPIMNTPGWVRIWVSGSLKNIHMLMKINFHTCSTKMVVVKGQVNVALWGPSWIPCQLPRDPSWS